jgi:hypothetical protein
MVSVEKTAMGQGKVRLEKKLVDGETVDIELLKEYDINLPANDKANFEIRAIDGTIKVRVNNNNVIDYNDKEILYDGKIGLFTGVKTKAVFDDYIVKEYRYKPGLAMGEDVALAWSDVAGAGIWQEKDGGVTVQKEELDALSLRKLDGDNLGDFVAEADINLLGNSPTRRAGIIFRSDVEMDNYLMVKLDPGDGRVFFSRVETMMVEDEQGGQSLEKVETVIAYEEIPIQHEKYYKLNVKVIGDHIEVRVNGRRTINAIDTRYSYEDDGATYIFTDKQTKAEFKEISISKVTPFDLIEEAEAVAIGVRHLLIEKLDTLSRTRNFDIPVDGDEFDVVRINGNDRLIFEIIGSDRADVVDDNDLTIEDMMKVALAENFCVRNPVTNKYAGDVNYDGYVDQRDVDLILELKELTSNANAEGYITNDLGLTIDRLNLLATKDFVSAFTAAYGDNDYAVNLGGLYSTALGDAEYKFRDLEALIRYADLTGDGIVNFRDRNRLVSSRILYEFIAVNLAGRREVRFSDLETGLSITQFPTLEPGTIGETFKALDNDGRKAFIKLLAKYVTQMADTKPLLRDFDGNGTYNTVVVDGENTEVSALMTTVTHHDDSQTRVIFHHTTGEITQVLYKEPYKTPKVIKTAVIGDRIDITNGYKLHTYVEDTGYMNITVVDSVVTEIYMMKTDFRDKFIWDKYRADFGEYADLDAYATYMVGNILQALTDRRDLNGDGYFTLDQFENDALGLGHLDTDLDLLNKIFDLTHEATTPLQVALMDVDGNGLFEDDDIELYEEHMVYMVDLDGVPGVGMYDLLELKKAINAGSTDAKFDLNNDNAVDDTDYTLLETALDIIKDIDGDSVYTDNDLFEMREILRYEEERRLIELSDLDDNGRIDGTDIDLLNRVRQIDVNGDEIIRAFVHPEGTGKDGKIDWSKLKDIQKELFESHNEDFVLTALMADLDLTTDLFEALDKNHDGVFDILDLPKGVDPYRFHEFDVFRESSDEGILSYYDEDLILRSIDNLLYLNRFDDETIRKSDINHDGKVDFEDYKILSSVVDLLNITGSGDIDLSGGSVPDGADIEALRYLAVLLKESDVNRDGFRDVEDEKIILAALNSYKVRYDDNVAVGSSVEKRMEYHEKGDYTTSSLVMKYQTSGEYTISYTINVPREGYYNIGLSARSLDGISIPKDNKYEFKIMIDGDLAKDVNNQPITLEVRGSSHQYNDGSAQVYIFDDDIAPNGDVAIEFIWKNAGQKKLDLDRDGVKYEGAGHLDPNELIDDTLQIKDAFLYTETFDERCDLTRDGKIDSDDLDEFRQALAAYLEYRRSDINGDGRVDEKDRQAFLNGSQISNTVWNQIVEIEGEKYYIRYHRDTDNYSINGGEPNEMGSKIIDIDGKDFLILEDIDGEVRLVEKLKGDVTGAMGTPDGNIDLWDWGLMTSRITNPPLRKFAADYLGAEGGESGGEMESFGVTRSGNSIEVGNGSEVTYSFDIREIPDSDYGFEFGLNFKNVATPPADPRVEYKFDVFVDGYEVKAGTIVAKPSEGFSRVYVAIDKDAFGEGEEIIGTHRVRFKVDAKNTLEIEEVFLRSADSRADIGGEPVDVLYQGEGDMPVDPAIFDFDAYDTNDDGYIARGEGGISNAEFDLYNADPTQVPLPDGFCDRSR